MKKTTLILIALSLALSLGFSACGISLAQDVTPPPGYQPPVYEEPEVLTGVYPETAPNPAAGLEIYQEKCEACHGDTGLGDGVDSTALPVSVAIIGAPQVANLASPIEWFTIVTEGNIEQFMPPFSGSLDEQDVWDVLSYVYTFGDAPEKAAAGQEIFNDICAACHGVDGNSGINGAADLTDGEDMVMMSIADIVQQVATGNGNQDHVFSTVLDEEQQEAVAYYVRSLVFPLEGEVAEEAAEAEAPTPEAVPTEAAAEDDASAETDAEATEAPEEVAADEDAVEGVGRVTGQIINGSGGEVPEGLEVSLEAYQHFELVFELSASVDADGNFVFEDVPIEAEQIYLAVVELDGLFFPSEFYIAEEGDTAIELPVTIYNSTASTEDLSVSRLHVFFQFTSESTVQVIHQVTISNSGSEMVAPDDTNEPVLNFSVPEGAQNLIFQSGDIGSPYVETADGFGDPTTVLPGDSTYELLFAYEMPYSRSLEWQLPVDLPMDVAVMFVQGDVDVDSSTMLASGTETLDTEVFQVFVANLVPAGETLDLEISGRVSAVSTGGSTENNWLVIGAGAVGVLLAAFGAWQFFRPVEDDYFDDDEAYDAPEGELSSETLLDEIVALDAAYEAGELTEEEYQSQRKALKAALQTALKQEKGR